MPFDNVSGGDALVEQERFVGKKSALQANDGLDLIDRQRVARCNELLPAAIDAMLEAGAVCRPA